jgi:nitrate reductase gamma subunit
MAAALLTIYAYGALALFALGVSLRLARLLRVWVCSPPGVCRTALAADGPQPVPWRTAVRSAICGPMQQFHLRANKRWGHGYLFYHLAIVTLATGYVVSALLVAYRVMHGAPVPDMATGELISTNYSLANLLVLVFGNGEALPAEFLFGSFAPIFVAVGWAELACAIYGNCNLMVTVVRREYGAITSPIDTVTANVRKPGRFCCQRLFLRLMISGIICTEVLGRLALVEGVVYVHAALALTLMAVFPFSYLAHVLYAPLSLGFAIRRRRLAVVA